MARTQPSEQSERQARNVVRERVHAWWAAALVGQTDEAHPARGTDVHARVRGDTLVITGKAVSAGERREIEREAERLKGHGIARVRNELVVVPETTDRRGLLVQTLIGFYDDTEQAGFAAGYLEGHALIQAPILAMFEGDDVEEGLEALHAIVPHTYWQESEEALRTGQTLLVVMVDEVDAFKSRALLEEETRSVRLLVLPPEPTHAATLAKEALRQARHPARRAESRAPEAARRTPPKARGSASRASRTRPRAGGDAA